MNKEQNGYESLEKIKEQTCQVLEELLEVANLEEGDIVVVGCSSSEVQNERIGSHSSAEIGAAIFEQLHKRLKEKGLAICKAQMASPFWLPEYNCEELIFLPCRNHRS